MLFPQFFVRYPRLSRSLIGLLILLFAFSFLLSINNGYAKQPMLVTAAAQLQTHDFTPVSQSHTSPSYLNVIEQSLIAAEGIKLSVYNDGQNIPTIGIGYNLKVRPILDAVVTSFGADPSKLSPQKQQTLTGYVDQMASTINSFTKGSSIPTLQTFLNKKMVQIGTLFPSGTVQSVFAFASPAKAQSLFDTVYADLSFESTLSSALGSSDFNDSLERAALISLVYNGVKITGTRMLADIQNNNRAEAWFEIRYGTNAANNSLSSHANQKIAKGVAIRRNYESDLFGLYDGDPFKTGNPSPVTNAEADQIFTMVLAHESTVFQSVVPVSGKAPFNNQYFFNPDTLIPTTNVNYKNPINVVKQLTDLNVVEPDFAARNLADDFAPAVNYLLTNPNAASSGSALVYNQPGSQVKTSIDLTKIGQTTPIAVFLQNNGGINQQVLMNAGNDLLYAQSNSTIILGQGVEQLTLRGATDVVDATQVASTQNLPIDTITFAGTSIAGTIPSSGVYNGKTYVLNGTTLVITSGSNTLTIKGFKSGNFGVTIGSGTCTLASSNTLQQPSQCPPPAKKAVFLGIDAKGLQQLWVTDGTQTGTQELQNIVGANKNYGLMPGSITSLGTKAVFSGYDIHNNFQLWVTDGTVVGTKELTTVTNSVGAGRGGIDPLYLTAFKGKVLFTGYDAKGNDGLWVTDGTAAGTIELTTSGGSITVFNNQVLFYGQGGSLWTTDGTAAGTKELANYALIDLSSFTVFGSEGLFAANTDAFGDPGLWITDGTVAGTHPVQSASKPGFALGPFGITTIGGKAVFDALDANSHYELWATDGTAGGTQELTTITVGSGSFHPSRFTALGNQALFMGYDTNNNRGLWITDGTSGGTKEVIAKDINPLNFTILGNQALFSATDPKGGNGLWITNGSTAGTVELKNVPGSFYGLNPHYITIFGSKALFNGYVATNEAQLWITDGTAVGTKPLTTTINPSGVDPDNFALLS